MNDQSKALYRHISSSLSHLLEPRGFRRTGDSFVKRVDGNFGLIYLITIPRVEELILTVEVGTCSGKVLSYMRTHPAKDPPKIKLKGAPAIQECQFTKRLGELMPVKQDLWWDIDESTDLAEFVEDLFYNIVKYGLPYIDSLASDTQMRDQLMSEVLLPADTANLIVLLSHVGPLSAIRPILTAAKQNWPDSAFLHLFDNEAQS